MIDLDAIKAEGRNDAEHSAELMRLYTRSQRVRLYGELCRQATEAGEASNELGAELWAHACERRPMPGWISA